MFLRAACTSFVSTNPCALFVAILVCSSENYGRTITVCENQWLLICTLKVTKTRIVNVLS